MKKAPKKSTTDGSEVYEVGYRKPPEERRFQPGKSGNPKGRPKGSKGLLSAIQDELNRKISVTQGGRVGNVTARKLVAKQLVRAATTGSPRHVETVLRLDNAFQEKLVASVPKEKGRQDYCRPLQSKLTSVESAAVIASSSIVFGIFARVAERNSLPIPEDHQLRVLSYQTHLEKTCTCSNPDLPLRYNEIARTVVACRQCSRFINPTSGGPCILSVPQLLALTLDELDKLMAFGVMLVKEANWLNFEYDEDEPVVDLIGRGLINEKTTLVGEALATSLSNSIFNPPEKTGLKN